MYRHVIKRLLDILISGVAIVLLAVPMLVIAIAIKIDDRGPVLFKQKRIGKNKNGQITYFIIWKFRSMKINTSPDVPTHLLKNSEQCITRVGRFIRKTSLDELPQIYQVFLGKLTCVGPRPGLWNQIDLWEAREQYGANDVKPGITGWAQINGRDELLIPMKAKFDGEYAAALRKGGLGGFFMDVRCAFGTVIAVLKSDGIVEGNKEEAEKEKETERV